MISKTIFNILFMLIFLFILLTNVTSAQEEGYVSVGFYITDSETEKPIKNAKIEIFWGRDYFAYRETSPKGIANALLESGHTYELYISHPNYTAMEKPLEVTSNTGTIEYQLKPKDSTDRSDLCCTPSIIWISIFGFVSIGLVKKHKNFKKGSNPEQK